MSQTEPLDQDPVFQLKGSMLAITVLELARNVYINGECIRLDGAIRLAPR